MRDTQDLYTLANAISERLERLDTDAAARAFAGQLETRCPALFQGMPDPKEADRAAELLARAALVEVKGISRIVEAVLAVIDDEDTEPAVGYALAGAMAYLVQPRDLLPDDLPGGFGFVDDAILLRSAVVDFLDYLPPQLTTPEREERAMAVLGACVPPDRMPEFRYAVEEIWLTFHALLWKSPDEVEGLLEGIIRDPLRAALSDARESEVPLPHDTRLPISPAAGPIELLPDGCRIRLASGAVIAIDAGTGAVRLERGVD